MFDSAPSLLFLGTRVVPAIAAIAALGTAGRALWWHLKYKGREFDPTEKGVRRRAEAEENRKKWGIYTAVLIASGMSLCIGLLIAFSNSS